MSRSVGWESTFNQIAEVLNQYVERGEQVLLHLVAEESQFTRFNRGRVRQTGQVSDGQLELTLIGSGRVCDRILPFTGDKETDWPLIAAALVEARQELPQLPEDPFLVTPRGAATSREEYPGQILEAAAVPEAILAPLTGTDSAGLYAGGRCIRGYADSLGQLHWFETETFTLDYSLFTADGQAVKEVLAGNYWDAAQYERQIETCRQFLGLMGRSPKAVPRGQYRTYLAPAAVADLLSMFSWGGISEAALRRSGGALRALQQNERQLSPKFHLRENFGRGLVPRFNQWGEVAPTELPLIASGELVNTLISSRTAQEYGLVSNYAVTAEHLRAPEVSPGTLNEADILKQLDTGLYVSNLHYLNWSDQPKGRVTGMTRYACFWVEQGEIVAPIQNLRFDESLYRCFGDCLVDLTQSVVCVPEVGSYEHRALGGAWVPGVLVDEFTYTL
ncbi:metallopeptidase TldD-related protein [Pseudanabaena sp. FACHB-2040]|uniref:metallopeptidase TldD-related protein n=1 Tax=Pseudanabaena sp. FACHB-2040 TaxID=2692859 RepID=UPI001684B448|nr:metallopeptidase TldD-related protein [Pseudanabaena sp. FACHB-2040]MBD2260025.1 TldD/PmbA family protein [Pseudanabaena sp. FACHB-2040]